MQNLFSPLIEIYKALYLFAYNITGNYGLALILLSLFTFVVLYPFNKKAQQIQNKEHKIQAVLAPQIAALKKQYSGQEQYEQLQWLYQRYGYHPLYAIRSALGFVLQIPFLTAAYYLLSNLAEIQGVSWGFIPNLGAPDHLLGGINVLPFVMTLVTVIYAFVMPEISKKERLQTIGIGAFFLILLYAAPSALLIFWTCKLLWSLWDSVFSKKLEWVGQYISENELALHIIFALSLTVGLLIPSDIYIKNASQLWFGFRDIFKFFIADTTKYFVILLLFNAICRPKSIKYTYLSILFGILLGVFLQSFIIGLDYGNFDGHKIEWEKYTGVGIINTIIWLTCIIASFVALRRLQSDESKIKKYIKPIIFSVIAIQCIVFLFTLIKNPIQKDITYEDGKACVLTTKNLYEISSKNNIIVFLLDAFDASVFEEILKKKSEVTATFKDFVFYPDTISSYGYTYYSLPEILTGNKYDIRNSYSDYMTKAWSNNEYYIAMKKRNFMINIYTNGRYVGKKALIDNLITGEAILDDIIANNFKKLAHFRMVPHCLKKLYYQQEAVLQDTTISDNSTAAYRDDDRFFYIGLKKQGLTINNESKGSFKFYHLAGMHEPYILDENVKLVKEDEGNYYQQAIGALNIVKEYINQLKKLDKYNESTFFILADHGYINAVGSRPIFLAKYPGAYNISLELDNTPITVAELMPMLFSNYLKSDPSGEKKFSKNHYGRFYYHEEPKKQVFVKFDVKSPASDINSWIKLGEVKKNSVFDRYYTLGENIDFSFDGNADKYKGTGWREKGDWEGSFITDRKAEVILNIKDISSIKNNITIRVAVSAHLKPSVSRRVELYANDYLLGDFSFDNKTDKIVYKKTSTSFVIPKTLLTQKAPFVIRFLVDSSMDRANAQYFPVMVEKLQLSEN